MGKRTISRWLIGMSGVALCAQAAAQDRTVLPVPSAPFSGVIKEQAAGSVPMPMAEVRAPTGAPNIFLFMSDDVGFAMASTFGGPVPTPNFDRLAKSGQRYNRFNTTALCSPSRAALLTGRNHHNAGTGNLADLSIGYPGYTGQIPASTATVAQVLRLNGYNTAMFGKHHNIPGNARSAMGPFEAWPTSLGFQYFFGFINGDTDQYRPNVYRNTTLLPTPEGKPPLFERRMADDTITWLHNQRAASADKPFFIYYAPSAMHAPHQVTPDYIARFKGQFDAGWDAVRQESYERQLAMGIIPQGTKLTPRPANIPAWETLSPKQKAYASRAMELAAGMLAFQDEQLGRVLDEFDRVGVSDNLLVALLIGDNGASSAGGVSGTLNELQKIGGGLREDETWLAANIARLGGEYTYSDYPAGWSWALSSPFPGLKGNAARLGGTRNGLVLNWAGHVAKPNSVCAEFGHVVDIAPTLLAAAQIPAPESVLGVRQKAMDGQNLLPSLSRCEPEKPRTQYFEMSGSAAMYRDGWLAARLPEHVPSEHLAEEGKGGVWELYDLRSDFSQSTNVAASHPDLLKELVALFDKEARRNNVYPLNAAAASRTAASGPQIAKRIDFWGSDASVPAIGSSFPRGASFSLNAEVDLASGKASGVIAALASHFAGWSFYLEQGRPTFVYARSTNPNDIFRVSAGARLRAGPAKLRLTYTNLGSGRAQARIFDQEKEIASLDIPRTFGTPAGLGEQLDIGRDTGVTVTTYKTAQGQLEGTVRHVWLGFDR